MLLLNRLVRLLLIAALASAVAIGGALPALADGPDQPYSPATPAEVAQIKQREAQVRSIMGLKEQCQNGQVPFETFAREWTRLSQLLYGTPSTPPPCGRSGPAPASPLSSAGLYSNPLGMPLVVQSNGDNCGPASGEMALRIFHGGGWITHGPNGEAVDQNVLAQSQYLATDSTGTGFDARWTDRTLNPWINANGFGGTYYDLRKAPGTGGPPFTIDDVWFDISWDVDNGQATIEDLHMYDSGSYLPGYSSEVWHYVSADGYRGSGDSREIHYVDPNIRLDAQGPHWYWLTTHHRALQDRGIVW